MNFFNLKTASVYHLCFGTVTCKSCRAKSMIIIELIKQGSVKDGLLILDYGPD